tara:strand:+ start:5301 stop:5567 length:267 start_codon:yes stop_codon:yes gene_type:complete
MTDSPQSPPDAVWVTREEFDTWALTIETYLKGYQVLAEAWMELRLKEPGLTNKHNLMFHRVKLEMASVKAKSEEIEHGGPGNPVRRTD